MPSLPSLFLLPVFFYIAYVVTIIREKVISISKFLSSIYLLFSNVGCFSEGFPSYGPMLPTVLHFQVFALASMASQLAFTRAFAASIAALVITCINACVSVIYFFCLFFYKTFFPILLTFTTDT